MTGHQDEKSRKGEKERARRRDLATAFRSLEDTLRQVSTTGGPTTNIRPTFYDLVVQATKTIQKLKEDEVKLKERKEPPTSTPRFLVLSSLPHNVSNNDGHQQGHNTETLSSDFSFCTEERDIDSWNEHGGMDWDIEVEEPDVPAWPVPMSHYQQHVKLNPLHSSATCPGGYFPLDTRSSQLSRLSHSSSAVYQDDGSLAAMRGYFRRG